MTAWCLLNSFRSDFIYHETRVWLGSDLKRFKTCLLFTSSLEKRPRGAFLRKEVLSETHPGAQRPGRFAPPLRWRGFSWESRRSLRAAGIALICEKQMQSSLPSISWLNILGVISASQFDRMRRVYAIPSFMLPPVVAMSNTHE